MQALAPGRLRLEATVNSDTPAAVEPVLRQRFPAGAVRRDGDDLVVRADVEGTDAKAANRELLSELRRAEKRTRLRARWTLEDGTELRFFDYVLKRTVPP